MATATQKPSRDLVQDNQRVRSPLQRVRGYIRTYVSLEGAALAGLFLAIAFWVSLVLDYGTFKAFSVDWVQLLEKWWGIAFLGLVGIGLLLVVVVKILTRLFSDFRDSSVAMVLERRFPDQLGDRLITAVELDDPEKAEEFGYSPAMVRETIHEAANRVDEVPVREVFDWKRLTLKGVWVFLLTVVAGGIAVGGFSAVSYAYYKQTGLTGWHNFSDVVTIWFERNVLLKNTPWPRRAQLHVLEPTRDPLRIGYDASAPTVRVRALKYVVADENVYEGWRPLTIADLQNNPDLLGVPPTIPPSQWKPRYEKGKNASLSLDEIELGWQKLPVRLAGEDEGLRARWVIQDPNPKTPEWRPLLWSDLDADDMGDFVPPRLTAAWDFRSLPVQVAGALGVASSPLGLSPLALGTALAVEPQATEHILVDEVAELIETDEFANLRVIKLPDGTTLPTVAVTAASSMSPVAGLAGGVTGAGMLANLSEVNLSEDVRYVLARLERLANLRKMLDQLDLQTDLPSMSRTMRRLVVPDKVTLTYQGEESSTTVDMTRNADNEYSNQLKNLKVGTQEYRVEAEDFYTPWREVIVLPPPSIVSLLCIQHQPAYLFYRPNEGKLDAIAGRKQEIEAEDIADPGKDISRIEVPAGTDVTLIVNVNQEVKKVVVGEARKADPVFPTSTDVNGKTIRLRFDNVRTEKKIELRFSDPDGVTGRRVIQIKVKVDEPPEMRDVAPNEIIRKAPKESMYAGMYMVTTKARIPFDGEIKDDHGISVIRYVHTLRPVSLGLKAKRETVSLFASAPLLARDERNGIGAALIYLASLQQAGSDAEEAEGKLAVHYSENLPAFERALNQRDGEKLLQPSIEALLSKKQKPYFRQLLQMYRLTRDRFRQPLRDPIGNDFSVNALDLTVKKEGASQPHYIMQLWMESFDTDLGSQTNPDGTPKPHRTESRNRFLFAVVGENDLLTEIGNDEEKVRAYFEQILNEPTRTVDGGGGSASNVDEDVPLWDYKSLIQIETDLIKEHLDLASADLKPEFLLGMANRIKSSNDVLAEAKNAIAGRFILEKYRSLIDEMKVNAVRPKFITKVEDDIVVHLDEAVQDLFPNAIEAMDEFRTDLETAQSKTGPAFQTAVATAKVSGEKARVELKILKDKLELVLGAMQKLTDINKLIQILRNIDQTERDQYQMIQAIKKQLEEKLLKDLLDP